MLVAEGRFVGIASAATGSAPAIRWSWSLSELQAEAEGSQGLISKRPAGILVTTGADPITTATSST